MSAKKAVCQLLGLDPAEHALEVLIRHGRPALTGTAGQRLGSGNILTTYADQGEVGLGIALIEPSTWSSGLVGIGIHLTNERFEGGQAWKQALEGAAHRATYAMRSYGEAIPNRAADIDRNASGETLLSGLTMAAARELRGDSGVPSPLKVRAINFSIGEASVGLVVVPSLDGRRARRVPMRPFGEGMPESGGARAASKTSYVRDEDGYFQLPEPGMTVVTLGDVSATRSIELARQGHHSIHIERDPEMLEMAERLFSASVEDFTQNRPEMERPMAQFREGDWYETRTQADRVEAYYPLHIGDVPRTDTPQFHPALRQFLNQALLSKLAPGGSGFVISEFRELVSGLEQVIREDPRLELVEVAYDRQRLPLIGGFGVTHRYSANSYLVFRLKP